MDPHPPQIPIATQERKEGGYTKEFFNLQIEFAKKLSEISGRSLAECLLHSTSLFRRFGLGKKLDENDATWLNFINWEEGEDLSLRAYRFYVESKKKTEQKEVKSLRFGCFKYDYNLSTQTVSIHFSNEEIGGVSPLSEAQIEKRKQELREMFDYIKSHHSDAKFVRGGSWLYNLERYRRLFPKEYTANLLPLESYYSGMSSWGQFFDKNNKLKPDMVNDFFIKLAQAKGVKQVEGSLPYKAQRAECEIEYFYKYLSM